MFNFFSICVSEGYLGNLLNLFYICIFLYPGHGWSSTEKRYANVKISFCSQGNIDIVQLSILCNFKIKLVATLLMLLCIGPHCGAQHHPGLHPDDQVKKTAGNESYREISSARAVYSLKHSCVLD